jgi:hypothetical protein
VRFFSCAAQLLRNGPQKYKKGAGNAFWVVELEGRNVNLDRVNESKRTKSTKNANKEVNNTKERP